MPILNALASLAVRDLAASAPWYEKVFGPGTSPMPELLEWHLNGGGGLQVYTGPERAGQGSCTILVTDIDETVELLRSTGAAPAAEAVHHGHIDTVMVKDPDGNSIAFAAPPVTPG